VNDEIALDPGQRFGAGELVEAVKLTAGKKRHALVLLG
jgi:tyrosyl-tRNA synthetase